MGWTFMNRPRGYSDLEWISREFDPQSTKRIVAISSTPTLMHLVVEMPGSEESALIPDENGNVRLCLVIMTKWIRGDYHNWGYKDISEFSGPCDCKCPARLLDLLSPFKPEVVTEAQAKRAQSPNGDMYVPVLAAVEWRARCRAVAAARAGLVVGQTYKLSYKLNFRSLGQADVFTLIERRGRRAIFCLPEGGRVRLRQENLDDLRPV